jgi:cobalamin biosynthesis protein CobD/CbiB
LHVRLGGLNSYGGEVVMAPLIGERFSQPSTRQAKQAIRIAVAVSVLGFAASLLLKGKRK